MKEKHNYKKQENQHEGKNPRKWVCEKKGWKSTSGLVSIILISSIITIAT